MIPRLYKEEKGQALTEFMLVIPIMLVLLLAAIQVGFALNSYLVLTGLARDAARVGSVTNQDAEIQKVIQENNPTLDPNKITLIITPTEGQRVRGDRVSVQLEYPVPVIVPLMDLFSGGDWLIKSSITMRVE